MNKTNFPNKFPRLKWSKINVKTEPALLLIRTKLIIKTYSMECKSTLRTGRQSAYMYKQHVCHWSCSKLLPWKQEVYSCTHTGVCKHEERRKKSRLGDNLSVHVLSAWLSAPSSTLSENRNANAHVLHQLHVSDCSCVCVCDCYASLIIGNDAKMFFRDFLLCSWHVLIVLRKDI